MKTLILLLFPLIYSAQIKVETSNIKTFPISKNKAGYMLFYESKGAVKGIDTSYILILKDFQYTEIESQKSIYVKNTKDFNDLYNVFMSAFTEEARANKDFLINLTIGDEKFWLTTGKVGLGGYQLTIHFDTKGFHYMKEKEIRELFGKK
jgi:hypothetical protein